VKNRKLQFVVLCLCVMAVSMVMLPGCSLLPKKKPAEPAVTGQPHLRCPIEQRDINPCEIVSRKARLANLREETGHEQKKNRLDAMIAVAARGKQGTINKRIYPRGPRRVAEVPFDEELVVYMISEPPKETKRYVKGGDPKVRYTIVFEAAMKNQVIMEGAKVLNSIAGEEVVVLAPYEAIKDAYGIPFQMEVSASDMAAWKERLSPTITKNRTLYKTIVLPSETPLVLDTRGITSGMVGVSPAYSIPPPAYSSYAEARDGVIHILDPYKLEFIKYPESVEDYLQPMQPQK